VRIMRLEASETCVKITDLTEGFLKDYAIMASTDERQGNSLKCDSSLLVKGNVVNIPPPRSGCVLATICNPGMHLEAPRSVVFSSQRV
jgi:hypothetical protein